MKDWTKTEDSIPLVDGDYLAIKQGSRFVEHLVFNTRQECWDDSGGDDYNCDIEKVAYWIPFPNLPKELITT